MKKICLFIAAVTAGLLAGSIYAAPRFNPDQLAEFMKTNQCIGCDLSGALIGRNHSGAVLTDANLSGIGMNETEAFNFSQANMQNANLTAAYLYTANFSGAYLKGAHFDGSDLTGANFFGAHDVNLSNANACMATLPDGTKGACW
ncbi:MAG: hypothetical protein A3J38_00665 [Gammaproteobacteria bacterium RIFCSPHIGHO2_12_FULL_45_9]|nr:MAG: hypothetical protein A3J38_00665 [Gammaproteobacteria bacterium RIFCSPHIGHO2_12_FULL_45_9]